MYCTNCGAQVSDDASFCGTCGASLQQEVMDAQQMPPIPVAQGAPRQGKRMVLVIVLVACIVAIVAVIAVGCSIAKRGSDAQDIAHQKVALPVQIEAAGLDYATSTPVPMRLQGTDFSGNDVDHEFLYDGDAGSVPEVERGQYTISVVDSPISGDGVMYALSNPTVSVVVTDYDAEEQLRELGHEELIGSVHASGPDTVRAAVSGAPMTLTPVAPIDVTDEMIDATCTALESLGYDTTKVAEHRQLVEAARNAARQEQLDKQLTFSDDRFSLRVPASWAGKWKSTCRVTHSVNGGRIPNAWQYSFYNSHDFTQAFAIYVEDGGSYGAKGHGEHLATKGTMEFYISNEGLSNSEFQAVVDSFVAK